jgi:hypothetical protein
VADDHRHLREELEEIAENMNKKNLFWSGAHGRARADAKTRVLHRYRDRLHESERRLLELESEESWVHTVWRKRKHLPELALTSPTQLEPVLNEWRADVVQHGSSSADRILVHDPTRWKLDDLIGEVRERPLERPTYPASLGN